MDPALKAARDRYTQDRIDFEVVLAAAGNIDARMTQCKVPSQAAHLGCVLFTKALLHARSLAVLMPPAGGAGVYDLSSAAVLVRAIAETFTAMRYICVEPADQEEFGFRLALLEYHQRSTTCRHYKASGIAGELLAGAVAARDKARKALEGAPRFQSQEQRARKRQLEGQDHMHRSHSEIAHAAGIDPSFWTPTYIFLSQFAHSSPLGVRQFAGATGNRPIAASNMALFAGVAAGLLAKAGLDLTNLVPDGAARLPETERSILTQCSDTLDRTRYGDLAWPQ